MVGKVPALTMKIDVMKVSNGDGGMEMEMFDDEKEGRNSSGE